MTEKNNGINLLKIYRPVYRSILTTKACDWFVNGDLPDGINPDSNGYVVTYELGTPNEYKVWISELEV